MNIRKMKKQLKANDGCVIKFVDQFKRKTYYFEISFIQSLPIIDRMKHKGNFIVLFSSNGDHLVFESIDLAQTYTKYEDILKVGSIYTQDSVFAIGDRLLTLNLFERALELERLESYLTSDNEFSIEVGITNQLDQTDFSTVAKKEKKSNSLFAVKKHVKKRRFDWNDAYLEGLRIHGNIDDAESHADDEEQKFKKNNL